jgi:LPXTG-motif cell wall-anchored protein
MEVQMLRAKLPGVVYAAATVALLVPAIASAQPANKRTLFTFTGPVDMPGVALPAGQYEFRLADPDTNRSVVQVRSRDGKKSYGLFLTHSAERTNPARDGEVRFMEAGAGVPPALRTWWYPGETVGYEFVYPKQQARRLAQRTRQYVLTTKNDTTAVAERDTSEDNLVRISPNGSESPVNEGQQAEGSPAGRAQTGQRADDDAAAAQAPRSATPAPVGTVARARTQLPQTASDTPLVAMIGMLLLMAAAIMHLRRSYSV